MNTPELDGLAAAVVETVDGVATDLRAEQAAATRELREEHEQVRRSLEQSNREAQARADRLQQEVDETRELLKQPAILGLMVDADGVLHMVQRDGTTLTVRLADEAQRIEAAVTQRCAEIEARMREEIDGRVGRALQEMGLAPDWSRVAAYTAGDVVSCYAGRTYRLASGVKASMGQEPGEHPEVWQRIGSHGVRVHKAKPATLQPGDLFTEADARFFHDGITTTMLSPKGIKTSDIERAVKPVHEMARNTAAELRSVRSAVEGLATVARAASQAANDARAWIASEGDAAVVRSAQTQAWCDHRAELIDAPALARIVERADEIDTLLDLGAG